MFTYKKVGGIRFLKVGRYSLTLSKRTPKPKIVYTCIAGQVFLSWRYE
jgi:hypothetical protein